MSDSDEVVERRLSLSEIMSAKSSAHKAKHVRHERMREEGWNRVDLNDSRLRTSYEPPPVHVDNVSAKTNLSSATPLISLFITIFSPALMHEALKCMQEDAPQVWDLFRLFFALFDKFFFSQVFVRKRGKTEKSTRRPLSLQDLYEVLAYRIFIQGRQERPSEADPDRHFLELQFKRANAHFVAFHGKDANTIGYDKARRFNGAFCVKVGSNLEMVLVQNFRVPFVHYGANVAADEKVFEFNSAKSGMLRVIPAKSQKGLWNSTLCATLPSGLSYLIDSLCATEIADMDEHTTMMVTFERQIAVLRSKPLERGEFSCVTYDSYYGTVEALQYLRGLQQPFIWAVNPQRILPLVDLISDRVRESGQMAFAVRELDFARQRPELLSCFWSKDSKKGKRYTITNYLKKVDHKRRGGYIPGFMEYEETFAACDKFNRRLHDKSWPHRYAAGVYSVEILAGHDFLFTSALVNMHHLWKTIDWKNRKSLSFKAFTQQLAEEITESDFSGF